MITRVHLPHEEQWLTEIINALGPLNAATGLWLHAVIRHRAQ
ncbi:MAG TPA: hypothetical protein VN969_29495 [Streptosporangiaceae bacterium]|nr:hypothetical protein [Streptosporangiaceae bacterium]